MLEDVQAQFGKVPNIFKTIANSPVAIDGFLLLHGALAGKVLSKKLPSAFVRIVAAIIVWPPIPKSVKKLGFQKKKLFPAGKGILPLLKLRQD